MATLLTLISSIASGEAMDAARRAKRTAMFMAVALVFLLCGVGFGIGAGYVAAAERYGSFHASLGFAGGFVALAILIVVIHKIIVAVEQSRIEKRRRSEVSAIATTAAIAAVPALLATKGGRTVGMFLPLVAVLGYAIYNENRKRTPPPPGAG